MCLRRGWLWWRRITGGGGAMNGSMAEAVGNIRLAGSQLAASKAVINAAGCAAYRRGVPASG